MKVLIGLALFILVGCGTPYQLTRTTPYDMGYFNGFKDGKAGFWKSSRSLDTVEDTIYHAGYQAGNEDGLNNTKGESYQPETADEVRERYNRNMVYWILLWYAR